MMKYKVPLILLMVAAIAGCSSKPTASNYNSYMNQPEVKHGNVGEIDSQIANKAAWNQVTVTQMASVRKLVDGTYTTNPNQGILTVRAVLVNKGDTPVQGNWRCKFYDSNNMPVYEDESNEVAKSDIGLGWHRMIVYPLSSKSQTDDANVVNCKAKDSTATNYRVEFHDTSNDITIYKQ
jgi:hypothetical protein